MDAEAAAPASDFLLVLPVVHMREDQRGIPKTQWRLCGWGGLPGGRYEPVYTDPAENGFAGCGKDASDAGDGRRKQVRCFKEDRKYEEFT